MSRLLEQLDDENLDFTVKITDTDGMTDEYEFLDIVCMDGIEYAVVSALDADGYVDIFRILCAGDEERYERVTDETVLDGVFNLFKIKNEDEFDFK